MESNPTQQTSENINDYITFRIGDETHIVIDENISDNTSIFSQQYKDLKLITNYITDNQKIGNELNKNSEKENRKKIGSNICAIIGDRGTGKTSCMESFCQNLCKDNTYISLDLIDPSYFDDNRNILHNIIGMMFKDYKHDIQKNESNDIFCNDTTHHLTKAFQNVKDNLDELDNQNHKNNDSLEALMGFASGLSLNENLHELVKYYLQYKSNLQNDNTSKESKLVIKIDDLDLNTEHGYQMMEQIRKYLNHDNIIIYVAMNIAQMGTVVQQELCKEYGNLLKANLLNKEIIKERAEKYIVKLFPLNQRVSLPSIDTLFEKNIKFEIAELGKESYNIFPQITNGDNSLKIQKYLNNKDNQNNVQLNVYDFATQLIECTTEYKFHKINNSYSLIVPRNLREYRHLIAFLLKAYDFSNIKQENKTISLFEKDNYQNAIQNQQKQFQDYFFKTYLSKHISLKHNEQIQDLFYNQDLSHLNHNTVQILDTELKEKYKNIEFKNYAQFDTSNTHFPGKELDEITDKGNKYYNISLGDVLAMKHELSSTNTSLEIRYFIFSITWLYTFKLADAVRIAPIQNKDLNFNAFEETMRDYDKIVAGSIINSNYYYIIDSKKKTNSVQNNETKDQYIQRNQIQINKNIFNNYYTSAKENNKRSYEYEYLLLLSLTRKDNTGTLNATHYRRQPSVQYSELFKDSNNIILDFTSFLYNISLPFDIFINRINIENIEDTTIKKYKDWGEKYFDNIEHIDIISNKLINNRLTKTQFENNQIFEAILKETPLKFKIDLKDKIIPNNLKIKNLGTILPKYILEEYENQYITVNSIDDEIIKKELINGASGRNSSNWEKAFDDNPNFKISIHKYFELLLPDSDSTIPYTSMKDGLYINNNYQTTIKEHELEWKYEKIENEFQITKNNILKEIELTTNNFKVKDLENRIKSIEIEKNRLQSELIIK